MSPSGRRAPAARSPVADIARPERIASISTLEVLVLAAIALTVVIFHCFVLPINDPHYGLFANHADMQIYRAAGEVILRGDGVYDGPVWWGMQWTYTPFGAVICIPLAVVDETVMRILFWSATFAALLASVVVCLRGLGYPMSDRRTKMAAALLAVAVTSLEPVRDTIWLGQINIFLMAGILWDLTRTTGRARGFVTGVAAGIKLTPLFFLLYLAVTGQWRSLARAGTGFATTVIVGVIVLLSDSKQYWLHQFARADRVGGVDGPANQSLNGALAQIAKYTHFDAFYDPTVGGFAPPGWLWIPLAVGVAAVGLSVARVAYNTGEILLAVTVSGMTAAVVSPFSWGHHWVWVVPLLIVALHRARIGRTWRSRLAPIVIVALTFTWWINHWDSGPWRGADHLIGIGLFMMPRSHPPQPWDYFLVPLYAACYPILWSAMIVALAVTSIHSGRRHTPHGKSVLVRPGFPLGP